MFVHIYSPFSATFPSKMTEMLGGEGSLFVPDIFDLKRTSQLFEKGMFRSELSRHNITAINVHGEKIYMINQQERSFLGDEYRKGRISC